MKCPFPIVWLVLLASPLPRAHGQGSASPDSTYATFLVAVAGGDWRTELRLIDPATILAYRDRELAWIERRQAFSTSHDSCLARSESLQTQLLADSVYLVPNLWSLAQLPPDTLLARRLRFEARVLHRPYWPAQQPLLRRMIGVVLKDDSTAYAVVEAGMQGDSSMEPDDDATVDVATLRRRRGTWKVAVDQAIDASISFPFFPLNTCR